MEQECATLSVPEAARLLGVGRTVGYRLAARGQIPAIRLGGKVRVPLAALRRLLENPPGPELSREWRRR